MKKIISVFIFLFSFSAFAQQEKVEISYTTRIILPDDFTFQPPGGGNARAIQEKYSGAARS